MPIFRLVDDMVFPPPDYADPSGLIAVGGDLSSERLFASAFSPGIRKISRSCGGLPTRVSFSNSRISKFPGACARPFAKKLSS